MPTITAASLCHDTHPPGLQIPLYEHQKRVLHAAIDLERDSRIVLSNEHNVVENLVSNVGFFSCAPGAGKSIVVLSLITLANDVGRGVARKYTLSSGSSIETVLPKLPETNLIVVPDLLFQQWDEYITSFLDLPPQAYAKLKTPQDAKTFIAQHAVEEFAFPLILLCTAEAHNLVTAVYHFLRVFYDEVDSICIPSCSPAVADRIWCLSSNIEKIKAAQVVNRGFLRRVLTEFKNLSAQFGDFLWDRIIIRTEPQYLTQSISIPNYHVMEVPCKCDLPINIVCSTDCIKGLLAHGLHAEMSQHFGIQYVPTKAAAIEVLTASFKAELNALNQVNVCCGNALASGTAVDDLRSLHAKQEALLHEIVSINDRITQATLCPITHSEIECAIATSCCFNCFETSFLLPWVNRHQTCPLCRQRIALNQLLLTCTSPPHLALRNRLENFELVIQHCLAASDARVMVFAGSSAIGQVRAALLRMAVPFSEFRGRVVRRTISNFESGNTNVLLADQNRYSTGMNIPFVSHMVIADPIDSVPKELFMQMVGRAHRIGRTGNLCVYTFKCV
jgi:hypothetical protein